MKRYCPKTNCSGENIASHGRFYRTSDSQWVPRFRCKNCRSTFSAATSNPCFGQKKRRVNHWIRKLLVSKVSQRRIAHILGLNRKTVARKIAFLGLRSSISRQRYLLEYKKCKAHKVQFDDLVTFEHSKCKPVAVSMIVEETTRKILDFEVSPMAANGPLAKIARKKYGFRRDRRKENLNRLLQRARDFVDAAAEFKSDEHPFYPPLVRCHFPQGRHQCYKGRRACVVGQGELKAGGFDPLFSLNHSFAMVRYGLARLVRRTWCTTKKLENLRLQLEVYIDYHNRVLTA